jgi:hypothetical protein
MTPVGNCNQSLGTHVNWKCVKGTVGCTSGHDGATYTRPEYRTAKAYVYYDGKQILEVVGMQSETTEGLLARAKGAIFVTVEPAKP